MWLYALTNETSRKIYRYDLLLYRCNVRYEEMTSCDKPIFPYQIPQYNW